MRRKQALCLCIWLFCFVIFRIYSVFSTVSDPMCIAVQFSLCVLQYTSIFADGCLSICPGNPCLFLTLRAIQRKKHQRSILVDLCACVRPAGGTFDPLGISLFFFHAWHLLYNNRCASWRSHLYSRRISRNLTVISKFSINKSTCLQ